MKKQVHIAAQYLAAAGKSFVKAKKDDSHTNLEFDVDTLTLKTRFLSNRSDVLIFNYLRFSLEWLSRSGKRILLLDGKTQDEVLQWLKEVSKSTINKTYHYDLHYDIPYQHDTKFRYTNKDKEELRRLCDIRLLAQNALEQVTFDYTLDTEIRIWPHHFDTGGFAALGNSGTSVGFGLAIPDSVCKEHYFYLSAYRENAPLSPKSFSTLKNGTWVDSNFKGAILAAKGLKEPDVRAFFKEAIACFKNSG